MAVCQVAASHRKRSTLLGWEIPRNISGKTKMELENEGVFLLGTSCLNRRFSTDFPLLWVDDRITGMGYVVDFP